MNNQDRKQKNKLLLANILFLIVAVLLVSSSGWLAENVFNYTTLEERVRIETNEIPVGEIETYICYITEYGECYHSGGCGSLWNSSYKTTVYEARKEGYRACSKCQPTEPTSIILTETETRDIHYFETVENYPKTAVILISCSCLLAVYIPTVIILKRKTNKLQRVAFYEIS